MILVMTPFWKRPEIVREYIKSLERLPVKLLAILSPEDPYYYEIMDMLPEGSYVVSVPNKPFGAKKNAGAKFAMSLEWDYMLELNSDSIVNPILMEVYKAYVDAGTLFFGLSNLYVVDYKTKETLFIPEYNSGMTFGAGRMIHRSLFSERMWTDELNEGMDDNMRGKLEEMGIKFVEKIKPID